MLKPIVRIASRSLLAIVLAATALAPAAGAEDVRLTVPYVKQAKTLCGAASATMVFRFWGDQKTSIQEFVPLVDRAAGGLATDVLTKAIEDRNWRVVRFTGSIESVSQFLREGRPLIVLLQEGRRRFHYVVVVGVTGTQVVVHDPARGPSRLVTFGKFMSAWEPTGFWSLLVLPGLTEPGSNPGGSAADLDDIGQP